MKITLVIERSDDQRLLDSSGAYSNTLEGVEVQMLVTDWRHGLEEAAGDYIHLTSDRYEPHPGWWQDAVSTVKAGMIPAPVVWTPDGEPCDATIPPDWSAAEGSLLPFLSRSQLKRLGPAQEPVGGWLCGSATREGIRIAFRTGYSFTLRA